VRAGNGLLREGVPSGRGESMYIDLKGQTLELGSFNNRACNNPSLLFSPSAWNQFSSWRKGWGESGETLQVPAVLLVRRVPRTGRPW
jgi:hypothetical protein